MGASGEMVTCSLRSSVIYLYLGSDRETARREMRKEISRVAKEAEIVRITDAHSRDDLLAALGGRGMFDSRKIVVLDGVFANEEMGRVALDSLPRLKGAEDHIFILEEKLAADARRQIEKYADGSKAFGAPKEKERKDIFALAYALKGGDKKKLWVEYQRALARDEAPEAIHGVLFWGAKDMFLKERGARRVRAARLLASLAELPHLARRRGVELEYALERYILDVNNGV